VIQSIFLFFLLLPRHQLCVLITFQEERITEQIRGKCLPVTAARVTAVAAASKIRMELRNFMIDVVEMFANRRKARDLDAKDV
jgi:hypothetical protein